MIMDYNISFIYKLYIHSINKYLLGKEELIFQGLEIITKKKKGAKNLNFKTVYNLRKCRRSAWL